MVEIIKCQTLVKGSGKGQILATRQTISFWGGVDPVNGRIIDPRHELYNQSITGKVLTFPYGKGSAAAPMVLLELAKQGTAPCAIINIETDPLLVAGPIISKHFYAKIIPVVLLPENAFDRIVKGRWACVDGNNDEVIIDPKFKEESRI